MIEANALKLIQAGANVPELIAQVAKLTPENPFIVLPSDMKLSEVDVEQYMPMRSSFKYHFGTTSIDDFVVYGAKHGTDDTICIMDADNPTNLVARNTFDLGNPGLALHQRHVSSLNLKPTAAYRALLAVEKRYSQREMSDWLEENSRFIEVFDKDGNTMSTLAAAASVRNMTIESSRESDSKIDDFSASQSVMDQVQVKGSETKPAGVRFTCIPFIGFSPYSFDIRFAVITSGDKPVISARHTSLEYEQEEIAKEFAAIISTGFKETLISLYRGVVSR